MSDNQSADRIFDPKTFDNYPIIYEELLTWPYRHELELPTLKRLLGDLSGLNVLDFGCGPGVISRWLHQQGAEKIVGYDISLGMLSFAKQCEEKAPLGITYFSKLDQKFDQYFDIILAAYVMPYVNCPKDLLSMSQDLFNRLKPGGKLITLPLHPVFSSDPEYYRPFGFRMIEKEPRMDGSKIRLHLCKEPYNIDLEAYYWSKETLENILADAGFKYITWKSLDIPENLPSELMPYVQCPHVAIIEANK